MKQTNPVGKRAPRNRFEAELFQLMKSDGWELTKRGFPDFACFRNGELILVEVKPKRSHRLKRAQYRLMLALAQQGVKCFRWAPDGGFTPGTPTIEHV